MQLKLGKHPPVFDERTLQFGSYLQQGLPTPPPAASYGNKVPVWPMYDNDKWGDCTCAAAGHMIQNWTANAGGETTPPDSAVDTFYEHFVGSPPPPDAGCNMLQVLRYWRRTGLGGHKILAFTSLEPSNQTEAMDALYMLGSVYIGLALPNFVLKGDPLTVPWVVPAGGAVGDAAPNQQNGHCVPAVAYDARYLYIVTWGTLKQMSWQFYDTYADEAYAVLSSEFIESNGDTVRVQPGCPQGCHRPVQLRSGTRDGLSRRVALGRRKQGRPSELSGELSGYDERYGVAAVDETECDGHAVLRDCYNDILLIGLGWVND